MNKETSRGERRKKTNSIWMNRLNNEYNSNKSMYKDIENLKKLIEETIAETDTFLKKINIDLDDIIAKNDTLDKLGDLERAAYDKIVER